MSQSSFNYKTLVIAREANGLTQKELADKLGIDQTYLSKIEQDLREMPDDLLERIAALLDFPISFFHEKFETYGFSTIYFRKRVSLPAPFYRKFKSNIDIRRKHIEKLMASVQVDLNVEYIEPSVKMTPVDIARHYRYKWKMPEGKITNLVEILEDNGIIILKMPLNHEKLDGITFFTETHIPVIYVNYNMPPDRINMNLAHELAHLVMHLNFTPTSDRDVEAEAWAFASEFLMPENEIKPYLQNLSIPELADLKRTWNVAMSAILYKAYHVTGTISKNQFQYLNIQLNKYYKRVEPNFGLQKYEPSLISELLDTYINEMHYTKTDLANLLRVTTSYLNSTYFGINSTLKIS